MDAPAIGPPARRTTTTTTARRHRNLGERRKEDLIRKPVIVRWARRGGVKRLSANIYEPMRKAVVRFLEEVCTDAITYMDYRRRKTLSWDEILLALRRQGRILY